SRAPATLDNTSATTRSTSPSGGRSATSTRPGETEPTLIRTDSTKCRGRLAMLTAFSAVPAQDEPAGHRQQRGGQREVRAKLGQLEGPEPAHRLVQLEAAHAVPGHAAREQLPGHQMTVGTQRAEDPVAEQLAAGSDPAARWQDPVPAALWASGVGGQDAAQRGQQAPSLPFQPGADGKESNSGRGHRYQPPA